jgi:hypothetical protein
MATNSSVLIIPPKASASVAETNDIRPIRPPVEIPSGWAWVWWLLVVAVLAALGVAAWLWWQKKRVTMATPALVPPHVRARQRLEAALSLLHDPRLFAIAVSDALRMYLEERFLLHAPERTTEEFLLELQESKHLKLEQKQALGQFLSSCDLVKFARYEPTETALRELLESALRLVDETRFEPLAVAASAPAAPPPLPPAPPSPELTTQTARVP